MRKVNIFVLIILIFLSLFFTYSYSKFDFVNDDSILTKDVDDVINTDNIDDPLRDWAFMVISNENTAEDSDENKTINWVLKNDSQIKNFWEAKKTVLDVIKQFVNYFIYLLSFVALVYLLYHGFIMLTAKDDTKYNEWMKWIKYAWIALAGIWLSYFIVSFIFYLVRIFAWS